MFRLIALGVLGYVGYRIYESSLAGADHRPDGNGDDRAVAGGPLSKYATIQTDPDQPPPVDPYG